MHTLTLVVKADRFSVNEMMEYLSKFVTVEMQYSTTRSREMWTFIAKGTMHDIVDALSEFIDRYTESTVLSISVL